MSNIFIKVLYGPYQANGIIKHKIQKIYGIITFLESNNFTYEAIPSPLLNRLTIEMNERVIYTCDIRYMKFNLPCEDDIGCQRIIDVINLHYQTFSQEPNVPKFPHVSEGLRREKIQDFSVDSTITPDTLIQLPSHTTLKYLNEEHEGEGWSTNIIETLRNWDKDNYYYYHDYGCYMQQPLESEATDTDSETSDTFKQQDAESIVSSCACLSLDPPSLYSVCYAPPPTSVTTEISPRPVTDLNEVAQATFSSDEWKTILDDDKLHDEQILMNELYEEQENVDYKKKMSNTYMVDIVEHTQHTESESVNSQFGADTDEISDILTDSVITRSPNVEDSQELKDKKMRKAVCKAFRGGKCLSQKRKSYF